MEIKIFISYYNQSDKNKMEALKRLINKTDNMVAVIIADRKRSLSPLTKKVIDGIEESQIIIPILTKESITSQWVNQEIGYATAWEGIKIMPVADNGIINDLKGFINKSLDIPNTFKSFDDDLKKERTSFRKCINGLIQEIKEDFNLNENLKENVTSFVVPKKKRDPFIKKNTAFFNENYFVENIRIYDPKTQLKTTLNPFIKNDSGILSFWANVKSHHNLIKPTKRELYIASIFSATNYSKYGTHYLNMWAILRETPTPNDKFGKWKFVCSGLEEKTTSIELTNELSIGWHLFSVEWSIQMDFIKFYIDATFVGERTFLNWPKKFNTSMYLGTWPDKNPESQFFSEITGPLFIGEIDSRIITEIYAHDP